MKVKRAGFNWVLNMARFNKGIYKPRSTWRRLVSL